MQSLPDTPVQSERPAYRLLVWLMTGCTSMPRWQGTMLRFFDAYALAGCIHCGRGKEPIAYQIGCRSCQRCVRTILRHHLLAEHRGSYSVHES